MNFNQIIGCNMRYSYTHKKIPKKNLKKKNTLSMGPKVNGPQIHISLVIHKNLLGNPAHIYIGLGCEAAILYKLKHLSNTRAILSFAFS